MTTLSPISLASGFANPVFDSQSAFRRTMEALSRPGRVLTLGEGLSAETPLAPAAAAIILALCDFETPLYLSPSIAATPGVAEFLRFHTDAPVVREPAHAAFALIDLRVDALDLSAFAQGTAEYPDRSTTVIALCDSVEAGASMSLAGPGIAGMSEICVAPLPEGFAAQWAANRAAFPLGVDILFAAGDRVVALPRSIRLIERAG
jgi:alpha-D-ribose 1-methylphosphonate 5-triphosphate synthase subunit PhnH